MKTNAAIHMADSVIQRYPVTGLKWAYEWGLALKGVLEVWKATGESKYFDYVKRNVDLLVQDNGSIRTYQPEDYNIDQINAGKVLFPLVKQTGDERYLKAIQLVRSQLRTHPRTKEGGFWHKLIYPHQMWLDGIYMAAPFLAQYGATFGEAETFDDVVHQITLIDQHTRDERTGLRCHAWDETKTHRWADPQTGKSPHFWGRAMGWYMIAIIDVLDYLPETHPKRDQIAAIFKESMAAVAAVQDQESGVWYQVLDQGTRPGNYLEASASCMFVYAMCKGSDKGYLDASFAERAQQAYEGITRQFVTVDEAGLLNLNRICSVAGLGGTPYRDGSFEYYVSEPIVTNDYKGVGPFILASTFFM